MKVDERKCKDEIDISYFMTKASRTTFTTYAIVHGVKIVP